MIYKLITTKNPNLFLMKILTILAIMMVVLLLYKAFASKKYQEGFIQEEPFVIKYNDDVFDAFYLEIYSVLHDVEKRNDKELTHILKATNPSTELSTILDIGCGTGNIVKTLKNEGYHVYGVDKSKFMVNHAKKMDQDLEVLHDDVMKPMCFEKNTFTHILCTYFTIYNFEDKVTFFSNCYHWMKPKGFLVVHMVDKDKFSKIIPNEDAVASRHKVVNQIDKLTNKVIFEDCEYIGAYEMLDDKAVFIETFKDLETTHVRQNETDLYMEDPKTICKIAKHCGFQYVGKTNMKKMIDDEHQYLYYFERPL